MSVPTTDTYTPELTDVGALITARTTDDNGRQTGTFTSGTRPTDTQVNGLIAKAVDRLAGRIGATVDETLVDMAKEVVALDVASRVELSYFPDQVSVGRTPYQELVKLHDALQAELIAAIAALGAEDGTEDELSPAGLPSFSFPGIAPADCDGFEINPRNARW